MWPPELAARKLVLLLRPPGWRLLAPELRRPVRYLACTALAAQAVLVLGWLIAGELDPGYSPVDQTVSELGARDAENPWIVNGSFVLWGAGFMALGVAISYTLQGRPWARVAPALFLFCGICAMLFGLLPLDCAATVDQRCDGRLHAGELSWRHYGHVYAGLAFQAALAITPFALARSEWPSRLARLTLAAGVVGLAIGAAVFLSFQVDDAPYGVYQRLGFGVVHGWVVLIAGALLIEASSRWPTRSVEDGPFASLFRTGDGSGAR